MKIRILVLFVSICLLTVLLVACGATLDTPQNLSFAGDVLSWDSVAHADAYEVEMDGQWAARVESPYYIVTSVRAATFRVRALSDGKRYTDSDFSRPLTYTEGKAAQTALSTPSIVDVNGQGLLSWSTVLGATGYRIWINNSIAYTVGPDPYYALTFTGDGVAKVQVQAIGGDNNADSARSASYSVTYEQGAVVPPRLRSVEVFFDSLGAYVYWRTVPNALSYTLYVNDTPISVVPDTHNTYVEGGNVYCRYTPTFGATHTQIYVLAVGDPALYRNSTAGNRLSFPLEADDPPADLRTEATDGNVYLTWDKVEHCLSYRLRLEQDGVLVGTYDTPYTRLQLTVADGEYQASVCALGNGLLYTDTQYSPQYAFRLVGGSLPALPLDVPADLTIADYALHFGAVAHATGYQISLCTPYETNTAELLFDVSATTYAISPALYDSVIYLSVRALGVAPYANSDWSAGVYYLPKQRIGDTEFPIYTALGTPSLRVQDGVLHWTDIRGAAGYELVINDSIIPCETNRYDLTALSGRLACKVRALSAADDVVHSPFSGEVVFTLPTRLDTPVLTLNDNILSWDGVAGANAYRLDINGTLYTVSATSVDLRRYLATDGTYTLRLAAIAHRAWQRDSLYSGTLPYVADYALPGSEAKPYTLSTAQDWAMLAQYPTAAFLLTQDLDLGDAPALFDNAAAFGGILDGGGHTVTAATCAANGLLGALNGATVRHLTYNLAKAPDDAVATLADYAQNCTFADVHITASATPAGALATVLHSTGCTYTDSTFRVSYLGSALVGGVAGYSTRDRYENVTVRGTLTGTTHVGAVCALADACGLRSITVDSVSLTCTMGDVGCVAAGTLTEADITATLSIEVGGVCYAGGVGGDLIIGDLTADVTLTLSGTAEVLFAGGIAGQGAAAQAGVDLSVTMNAQAQRAYVGGCYGFANGAAVCTNTCAIDLSVQLDCPSGTVCGLAALGYCLCEAWPSGTVNVPSTMKVAYRDSNEQDEDTPGQWVVHTH